jgi:hypothetical protein
MRLPKTAALIVVLAVVVAPYLHGLAGCDDDSVAVSTSDSGSAAMLGVSGGSSQHHSLPDGSCCGLALAVVTFAYSGHRTYRSSGADSVADRILAVVSTQIGFDSIVMTGVLFKLPHPPPLSVPIFLSISSLLI